MSLILALCFLSFSALFTTEQLALCQSQTFITQKNEQKAITLQKIQDQKEIALFESFFEATPTKKEPKQTLSSKEHSLVHFKGGINLYHLLQNEKCSPLLEEVFYRLFDRLYAHASFYYPSLASDLLKVLREQTTFYKGEKDKKLYIQRKEDLAKLVLEDLKLKCSLYYILKGACSQDPSSHFHSLLEFVEIDRFPNTQINLFSAPYDLLCVLYDEKTAQYILDHKKTWKKGSQKVGPFSEGVLSEISKFYGPKASPYQPLVNYRVRSK